MRGLIYELRRRTPLGWLQLSRKKSRLLVALLGIAFADILMFMQFGFQQALYDSNTSINRAVLADIVLISPLSRNMQNLSTFSRRRLFQAYDVPGVKSTQALYIGLITWKNPQTRKKVSVQVMGFNPDELALNIPGIDSHLEEIRLPDTFIFDRGSRGDYNEVFSQLEQGKIVTTEIEKRSIRVSGLFTLGASFGYDGTLISSDENFLRIFPKRQVGGINLGLINLEPGYDPKQVAEALKSHLISEDIKVLTREEFIQLEMEYWKKESPIGFIFGLGAAMGFLVGVALVYQVLSTDVNAHMREYATFKAMGYRNSFLLGVIFEEAMILAILGFIPGFIVPLGLYDLTRNATTLPLYMTLNIVFLVLSLTIFMCIISGAIATRKLRSADPADMF
ncbi:DevC protein [Cylindrospermum sp. NIES-4074]|nr:DevC protein [Cylindrospermum sp. NIES-4074]